MQTDYKEKSTITVDENDILKMSAKIQQNKSENAVFRKQLDKYFSGAMPSHEVINVCSTPNVLKLLNSTAKKVVLNQKDLENAVSADKSGNTGHTEGHNISKEELYKLSDEIRNPIMILKGNERNKNSVVLITDMVNKNGENVFVPIALDRQNGKISNISTLYGKKNLSKYIAEHKSEILSLNIEKTGMLADTGVQFSQSIYDTVTCYGNSIAYSTQNVKRPEQNIQAEIENSLSSDKSISGSKTNIEYYSLSSQPNGKFGIFAISADGNITAVEPNIQTEKEAKSIFNAICENKSNIEVVPLSELRERSRSQLQAQSEKLPDVTYRIRNNLSADKTPDNSHAVIKMYRNENSDTYALGEIMVKGSYDKCNQALAELLTGQDIKRDILSDLHADIGDDGNFKVNHEYYSSLPRSERAIEQLPADKALNIMQQLNDNSVEFSATSRKNNMTAITVSKKDLPSLQRISENILKSSEEKALSNETSEQQKTSSISEKINPEYYNQLKKDERKVIRLPHNSGDKAISALQSAGIPFSAVKSEKLTSITVHKDNAQALDQIISDGSKQTAKEYINSDFFKSLPPEERLYTQVSGTDKANELMSELKNNNIGFSAVVDKENNSTKITVAKKDASALKKVTDSLFSRKAQKDFFDKAKSINQEHDTRNIVKNKDNQHSI